MRAHAQRLDRLEAAHKTGRHALLTPEERKVRLDFLFAKAGVENTPEACAAFVAELRQKHGQGSRT